jgi:hypothetical protein
MSRSELERVQWGPEPGQPVGGIGSVRIVARAPGQAEEVLYKAKEAMAVVASVNGDTWPSIEKWRELLPKWFVEACPPEPSKEQIGKFLLKSPEERRAEADMFTDLGSWLYWFQPENRYWFWWDGAVADEDTIIVAIEVTEWPFPWEALRWLLRAAGASSVEAEQ